MSLCWTLTARWSATTPPTSSDPQTKCCDRGVQSVSASADIDYGGIFTLTSTPSAYGEAVQIDWQVTLDAFPAFEGYVDRDGDIQTLFTIPPPEGNTVQDLLGDANQSFSGSVTMFPNIVVTEGGQIDIKGDAWWHSRFSQQTYAARGGQSITQQWIEKSQLSSILVLEPSLTMRHVRDGWLSQLNCRASTLFSVLTPPAIVRHLCV